MASSVFRFAVVRPPQRVDPDELATRTVRTHPPGATPTGLLQDLLRLRSAGDRAGMRRRSREHINPPAGAGSSFVRELGDIATPMAALDRWLLGHRRALAFDDFKRFAEITLGAPISSAVQADEYKADRNQIADSLLALNLAADPTQPVAPHLTRAMRIFGLLERTAADETVMSQPGAIEEALKADILLPGDLYPLPPVESPLDERNLEAHRKRLEAYESGRARMRKLTDRLKELSTAIDELGAAFEIDRRTLLAREATPVTAPAIGGPVAFERPAVTPTDEPNVMSVSVGTGRPSLSEAARDTLSESTRRLLTDLRIGADGIDVPAAVAVLEEDSAAVARDLYLPDPRGDVALIGTSFVTISDILGAAINDLLGTDGTGVEGLPSPCPSPVPESPVSPGDLLPAGPGLVQSVGVADLMVVEQELQKYEAGEIAHIENVLVGETKERTHRRARTTEETVFEETEITEETERDLESTERFELQTEAQQVINEDTSIEAGVTTTGKYGWVEFTADARYASNTAREESQRTASSYSRDVTDRAVSRIQERVLRRRTRRTIEEFEETNLHRLDNSVGPEHVIGIYRWVDKIYKAQLINYGRRAMFELVIPQPASFLKYAMSARPKEGLKITKPDPPGDCYGNSSAFVPLRPQDITPEKYLRWVAKYNVTGVEPPPPLYKRVAAAFDKLTPQVAGQPQTHTKSDKVEMPDGYVARWAYLRRIGLIGPGDRFFVVVGNKDASNFNSAVALDDEDKTVPVVIVTDQVLAFAFTLEVQCERTQAKLEEWQLATFNSIMTAYRDLQAQYDEQLVAFQVRQGVAIQGRNPLANRQVEQTELKRAAISILTDQHFDLFDALRKNVPEHGYPQLDLDETVVEGPYIRFFEQAFEWENMVYLFYPYYWGRKEDWPVNALLDDTDPLFAQFLRAGAARVVVPARPGFEAAVCSYLNNGWPVPDEADPTCADEDSGKNLPLLSIVDEIKTQQGYNATPGEGTITVTQDSPTVIGTDTAFDPERDTDREIHIAGAKYRIATITSATEITLTTNYSGPSASGLSYALGVKYVGEPWEVRVPTSLVLLQSGSDLPEFN